MKKTVSILLALLLVLSLAACGSSAGGNAGADAGGSAAAPTATAAGTEATPKPAATEAPKETEAPAEPTPEATEEPAEPEPTAVQWDKTAEYRYEYDDGITLLNDGIVRITAWKTDYVSSEESASGMRLVLRLNIENLTDSDISISYRKLSNKKTSNVIQCPANEESAFFFVSDDWNCMMGETEDCRVDTCQIDVKGTGDDRNTILDSVLFDWYVSEKTPFVRIVTGEEEVAKAADRREVERMKALDVLYHAENELISMDIVKTRAANNGYTVTYIVTNRSDAVLYTLDPSEVNEYTWTKETGYAPGESWLGEEAWVWDNPYNPEMSRRELVDISVSAYNAAHQQVAELTVEATVPKEFPEEPTDDPDLKFALLSGSADPAAAEAYQDLSALEPMFTIVNAAVRIDALAIYDTENEIGYWNYEEYIREVVPEKYLVYAVTNITGQTLYSGKTGVESGESIYKRNSLWNSFWEETSGSSRESVLLYVDESNSNPACMVDYSYDWTYDPDTREIGVSNFAEGRNEVYEEALSGDRKSYTYYSGAVLAETEYYRIELRSLDAQKNDSGIWDIDAQIVIYNTSDSRYLLFDPGKQSAGYDPGADWFDPGDGNGKFITLRFTSSSTDSDNITGELSYTITGYSWNGSAASKLFEDTVTATLKVTKPDPVVSAEVN